MLSDTPRFERVYLVADFTDHIRAGVADYRDRPHYFETEWDESADDYGANIDLFPLTAEQFVALQEEWLVWIELEQARLTSPESGSIESKIASERRLENLTRACETPVARARGVFRTVPGRVEGPIPFSGVEVQWLAPQPQECVAKRRRWRKRA